jgi:hypothetical protein
VSADDTCRFPASTGLNAAPANLQIVSRWDRMVRSSSSSVAEASSWIPLLIGTASFTDGLGYAVPPGNWGLQATLALVPDPRPESGERLLRRTQVLPLTVTA